MLNFELPMVRSNIPVHDAIKDIIDSKTSGLLFSAAEQGLRLLHYKNLVESMENTDLHIIEVKFEPVMDLTGVPEFDRAPYLQARGNKIGLTGMGPINAFLYSLSEGTGLHYTYNSGGRRCTRPNRPQNVPARDWYHYYPPHQPYNITICKLCSASVP